MTDAPPDPMLWNVARAAQELSLSRAHVYRLVREKRIPHIRVGESIRFSPAALQKWLNDKQISSLR